MLRWNGATGAVESGTGGTSRQQFCGAGLIGLIYIQKLEPGYMGSSFWWQHDLPKVHICSYAYVWVIDFQALCWLNALRNFWVICVYNVILLLYLYYIIFYYVILYNIILYYILFYYTILCYIILCYIILYCIILYYIILYYIYYIILYCIVLYYIILYYICMQLHACMYLYIYMYTICLYNISQQYIFTVYLCKIYLL